MLGFRGLDLCFASSPCSASESPSLIVGGNNNNVAMAVRREHRGVFRW